MKIGNYLTYLEAEKSGLDTGQIEFTWSENVKVTYVKRKTCRMQNLRTLNPNSKIEAENTMVTNTYSIKKKTLKIMKGHEKLEVNTNRLFTENSLERLID